VKTRVQGARRDTATPRRRQAGAPLPSLLVVAKVVLVLLFLALPRDEPESRAILAGQQMERDVMGRIATAGPEIERRLAQWLQARDGLLYLREPADSVEPYGVHVLPLSTPWTASCGELGLSITIGRVRTDLTDTALDEGQCRELLGVVARTMQGLTAPPK